MKPRADGSGHAAGLPTTRHLRRHPYSYPTPPQGTAMNTATPRRADGMPSDWYVPRPGVTRRTAARVLALVCTCVLASVLAVALLGLAGCGGGGDSDADLDEPLAGACYVAGQLTAQQACTPDRHLPTLPSADASR